LKLSAASWINSLAFGFFTGIAKRFSFCLLIGNPVTKVFRGYPITSAYCTRGNKYPLAKDQMKLAGP
jgi:hypothetical protein